MNYKNNIKNRLIKRGKMLLIASSACFAVFFSVFFAAWFICPRFSLLVATTLPFAALGIMFWIKFGIFTDRIAAKCPSSKLLTNDVKKVSKRSCNIVYHYSAARYLYRTNVA